MVVRVGYHVRTMRADLQSAAFNHSAISPKKVNSMKGIYLLLMITIIKVVRKKFKKVDIVKLRKILYF